MALQAPLPTPDVRGYIRALSLDEVPDCIAVQLQHVAAGHDYARTREFACIAARVVASRYCECTAAPERIKTYSNLAQAVRAGKRHPGVCRQHQSGIISNVRVQSLTAMGVAITTKQMRNQAWYNAAFGALNAKGKGVQLRRCQCFTHACRALWPGDEPLSDEIQATFKSPTIADVDYGADNGGFDGDVGQNRKGGTRWKG